MATHKRGDAQLSLFEAIASARAEAPPPSAPTQAATPQAQAPIAEAPIVEAPIVEAPIVEAPIVEAPIVEAPIVEAPIVEAPIAEAPIAEAPIAEAPIVEAPIVEAPRAETATMAARTVEPGHAESASETAGARPGGFDAASARDAAPRFRAWVLAMRAPMATWSPQLRWAVAGALVAVVLIVGWALRSGDAGEAPALAPVLRPPPPAPRATSPVTARLERTAEGARFALVGAAGRHAFVVAVGEGEVVRLYPFEEGESVPVESDAPLDGLVSLPADARYRLFALISDAPASWSVVEPRARSLAARPTLEGFDVVELAWPPAAAVAPPASPARPASAPPARAPR